MSSFLQTHWRNTVYSNVWIALGAGLWVWAACEGFDTDGLIPGLFTASSTVFVYNFQRLVKLAYRPQVIVPGRNEWLYQNRFWMLLWVLAGLAGTAYAAWHIDFDKLLLLLLPCALAMSYVFRIIPSKRGPIALREIPGVKIFLIAFTWAIVCGTFPASFASDAGYGSFFFTTERFFFILAITIPFDIRDLRYDHPRMRTLPQILGVKKALNLALAMVVLSGLMAVGSWLSGLTSALFLSASLAALLPAVWLIRRTHPDRPELFFTSRIDGLIVLQALLQGLATFY